jgi:hypothetical protein
LQQHDGQKTIWLQQLRLLDRRKFDVGYFSFAPQVSVV